MKERLILNGTKLVYHLERLNQWNKGETVFPIFVEISPVAFCNQACIFCAYEYLSKTRDRLETSRLRELLDEFSHLGINGVFYSGEGEPLLHPDMVSLINYSRKKNLDCALNTNGILLTQEVSAAILKDLSWIRFSINAGTEKSYKRIHRAKQEDFRQLLKNLEDAVSVKRSQGLAVSLGVQLVYIKQPFAEIYQLAQLIKDKGLDYFAIKQFNKHPLSTFDVQIGVLEVEELKKIESLSDEHFSVAVRESFDSERQKRHYKHCFGFDFFAEVKADGGVYPCGPLLGITQYCYGNIYEHTFEQIWLGERRKGVLRNIYKQVDVNACMPNCRLHSINEFLWQLKSIPAHVNFI